MASLSALKSFSRWRQRFWPSPDALFTSASVRGELLVARIRVLLTALLLPIVLLSLFSADDLAGMIGLGVIVGAWLISLTAYLLVKRGVVRSWLGFATSCADVTLVTVALAVLLTGNGENAALNSIVVFEGYFVAIAGTCLRYDRRICVVAGLLALTQYMVLSGFGVGAGNAGSDAAAAALLNVFTWRTHVSRLILLSAASLLSIAVVKRTQELVRLSTRDSLTGLFNRSHFNERAGIELSRASRSNQSLTVAMVDVDHFKSFNDRHGHPAGDVVLRFIANMLRHSFRRSDIVGRYGGEEFVIAMPDTDAAAATQKLEGFREIIANTPVPLNRTGETVRITISAGVAGYPMDGIEISELLDIADARLFQAKGEGRNRVVV